MLIELLFALEAIKTLFEAIPVIFYAATSAACITLFGAWLQNRAESQRNLQRLQHDALQRDREREMTMRREVYLKAAEALAHAQENLAGFANLDISSQQHEVLIKGIGADLNKVHIVGSMQTVHAIVDANQFFTHAVSDLTIHRLPLQQLTREIAFEQLVIESASARRDEALASLKEMSGDGQHRSPLWEIQDRIFNEEQKEIEAAAAKIERLQQRLSQDQLAFLKRCAKAGLELGALVVKANVAIRRELELYVDAEEYLKLMRRSYDALGREVDAFHRKIEQAPDFAPIESKNAMHKARAFLRLASKESFRGFFALSPGNPVLQKAGDKSALKASKGTH